MFKQHVMGLWLAILIIHASEGAQVEQVQFLADRERLAAYRAIPSGSGPFPAVLFLHGGRAGVVGGDPKESVAALARAGAFHPSTCRPSQHM